MEIKWSQIPIEGLEDYMISEDGNVFSKLINQWSSNTNVDIVKQIKEWNAEMKIQSSAPTPYSFKN